MHRCRRLATLAAVGLLAGCAIGPPAPGEAAATPPTGDTSRNALDWPGRYRGVLPCADCEGIETVITLGGDQRYTLATRYLGREPVAREVAGTFAWNDAGNVITLGGLEHQPAQYLVGENVLIQLDLQGQRITGELASRYRLDRLADAAAADPLAGTRWQLVELYGRPVEPAADGRRPYLLFAPGGGSVSGFAGCNRITGGYAVPAPARLSFSRIARTMMACAADMEVEEAFLRALETVDGYATSGGTLSLHRARMAPLARLEAVPQ